MYLRIRFARSVNVCHAALVGMCVSRAFQLELHAGPCAEPQNRASARMPRCFAGESGEQYGKQKHTTVTCRCDV